MSSGTVSKRERDRVDGRQQDGADDDEEDRRSASCGAAAAAVTTRSRTSARMKIGSSKTSPIAKSANATKER